MTKKVWAVTFGAILAALVFLMGLTIPVSLSVKPKDKIYAGQYLEPKDFEIKTVTLFGVKYKTKSKKVSIVRSDGNVSVKVLYGAMHRTIDLDPVLPESLSFAYGAESVLVGQPLDKALCSVKVVYKDKTEAELDSRLIYGSDQPVPNVEEKVVLAVQTALGDASCELPVVRPKELKASYTGKPLVGDVYSKYKVKAELVYPDGSAYQIYDFACGLASGDIPDYDSVLADPSCLPEPMFFSGKTAFAVTSPYGTCTFEVKPKKSDVTAVYNSQVYEGDAIDPKLLSVKDGEKEIDKSEYAFTYTGFVYDKMSVRVPTRYGTGILDLDPVKVKSVLVDAGTDIQEGAAPAIRSVKLLYEDGKETVLDKLECVFLNLPEKWGQEQTVWFSWHGKEYSFDVTALSENVAAMREDAYEADGYSVDEKTAKMLALVCQRVGGSDLSANSDEFALMANRYEMDGNADKSSGALYNYIRDNGYWGVDLEETLKGLDGSYPEPERDAFDAVKDGLGNGYRSMPLYITERIPVGQAEERNTSGYQKNLTEIRTLDGRTLRFYKMDKSGSYLYCYEADVYKSITGQEPQEAAPWPDLSGYDGGSDDGGIVIE